MYLYKGVCEADARSELSIYIKVLVELMLDLSSVSI